MTYVPGTRAAPRRADDYDTIQIISRGTPPDEKVHSANCKRCKSQFKFKGKSKGVSATMNNDGSYKELSFLCPVCSHTVSIKPVHPDEDYSNGGYR